MRRTAERPTPLIGALCRPLPRWTFDAQGVAVLDQERSGQSDRYGTFEPSALYRSLEGPFESAVRRAEESAGARAADGSPALHKVEARALQRASLHWLRHVFSKNAGAYGALPVAPKGAMEPAFLRTISLDTCAEDRPMVRRRG